MSPERPFNATIEVDPGPLRFCLAGLFESDDDVAMHAHGFHELILITEGSCWISVGGDTRLLDAGDLIVIPRQEKHDQHSDGVVKTCYIGGIWPDDMLDHRLRVVRVRGDVFLQQWMHDLVFQYKHEHPSDPIVIYGLLAAILGRVRRAERRTRDAGEYNPYYANAVRYIESHVTDDLTVSEIADHVGCSASYLTALFREHLDCGPIAYQIRCRMNLACKHLLEPYLNVKQVAAACGWHDHNLFVRLFRQRMGLPPGQWRQQQAQVAAS